MAFGDPAEEPATPLGFHRVLAPVAGVRCSPLCLGAMNFGDAWKDFMGECNKDTTFEMLDYFYQHGGNFIDTYTTNFRIETAPKALQSNFTGNNTKSLHVSLEASLKKLRTSYIDVLYVHWWDWTASIPEVMKALNTVADQGKILYLGVSDTPAWIVSQANQYARDHGMRQFVVYQGQWSAAKRDFERDIIPMCAKEGMALAPWGALGGGNFKTEDQRKSGEGRQMGGPSENDIAVSKVLEKKAKEHGTVMTSIALAYVMAKTPNVFPIVGGRKTSHLKGNIDALKIKLTEEDIDEIDSAYPFEIGFPMNFLFGTAKQASTLNGGNVWLTKMAAHIEAPETTKPVQPRK